MKEELVTEKKYSTIFVPFLAGGLVGAGIALLLAPKAGKDLRKDIKDLASDTREKMKTTIVKGKDLYEEATSAVKGAIDAGKAAFIEERDKARHAA